MQTEFPERYITLGLKIAYYRKKAGMTQEVLAERIGKSVNFVGQVEGTGTVRGVCCPLHPGISAQDLWWCSPNPPARIA